MKYKVGDKVRIKSLDWYNENKDVDSDVLCGEFDFVENMKKFCSETFTISEDVDDCYLMLEDNHGYVWTDEMIEGLVEEETKPLTYEETVEIIETMQGIGDSWECPQGYQFVDENGNVINATKIVLEKKKKEYPKTFVEVLDFWYPDRQLEDDYQRSYKKDLIKKFQDLLYARNAYWKIYGEKMGLGEPWKPNWLDDNAKYSIYTIKGMLTKAISCYDGAILTFPTAEMRDAFYENFKKEIESCKELL